MKVTLYYDDINVKTEYHKTLRITLPKSWKTGPTSKLLQQFIDSYNTGANGDMNPLIIDQVHLEIRQQEQIKNSVTPSLSYSYYSASIALSTNHEVTTETEVTTAQAPYKVAPGFVLVASDAIVVDVIQDRCDIFVRHGPSMTMEEIKSKMNPNDDNKKNDTKNTVQCTRFGCMKRFPKGGPYPAHCIYHKSPPVFHETAKFWSCCPHKKAYDFDDFQTIPGCQTADYCTDQKENQSKNAFLGGMDLREQMNGGGPKLRSIEEFNREQQVGTSMNTLDRLQNVLLELGIEKELYLQVFDGFKKEIMTVSGMPDTNNEKNTQKQEENDFMTKEMYDMIQIKMGKILKDSLKQAAAEQLRIK